MKLIDADELLKLVDPDEYYHSNEVKDMIDLVPTVAFPPNDPLTLDELRGMQGEPVWVEEVAEDFQNRNKCRVLKRFCGEYVLWTDDSFNVSDNCGKTWLAYRRKPEEVKT